MTKKMMDIMRGGFKTRLITEDDSNDDSISPKQGDAVYNDELKKLRDIVNGMVEITNFKIYPSDKNVIIEGVIDKQESEDSGIKFKMSLTAGQIETSMNNVDLNDEISGILQRIKGYYSVWRNEWGKKIVDEYKPKENL